MKSDSKSGENVDYEKLYYKAMSENILLKGQVVSIELLYKEIEYIKSLLYSELIDIQHDKPFDYSQDDEETDKEMKKINPKKEDILLLTLIEDKKQLIENLIKKLMFEK